MPVSTRTQTKRAESALKTNKTRVTRSQSAKDQIIEWEYLGKEKSCNGLQHAKKGDFVHDDCNIQLPGSPCRFKSDNYFVLVKISNDGFLHGYYEYNGEKIPHKRSKTRIRKKNKKRKRFKDAVASSEVSNAPVVASSEVSSTPTVTPETSENFTPEDQFNVPPDVLSTSDPSRPAIAASPENLFFVPPAQVLTPYSRKSKPEKENPLTQEEFMECERGTPLHPPPTHPHNTPHPIHQHTGPNDLGKNETGQDMIYVLRAIRQQRRRCSYTYEGRVKGSRTSIPLSVRWLNENKMVSTWRSKTILQRPGYWYRVRVEKSDDQPKRSLHNWVRRQTLTYMGLSDKLDTFKFH